MTKQQPISILASGNFLIWATCKLTLNGIVDLFLIVFLNENAPIDSVTIVTSHRPSKSGESAWWIPIEPQYKASLRKIVNVALGSLKVDRLGDWGFPPWWERWWCLGIHFVFPYDQNDMTDHQNHVHNPLKWMPVFLSQTVNFPTQESRLVVA